VATDLLPALAPVSVTTIRLSYDNTSGDDPAAAAMRAPDAT